MIFLQISKGQNGWLEITFQKNLQTKTLAILHMASHN